jgi:dihydroflavonol-4-reductase
MRGVDRVFHVAGTTNFGLSRERLFALNVEGTRIVLEEALRAGVQRAILTSSAAAIGPARRRRVADETQVWDAGRYGIPYVDSRHEAEVEALRLISRGLPLVIVNPTHVLGPGDAGRSSTTLVRRFMRRQIPAYVDGTLNIVGVEDVAAGHLLAAERGEVGERYILGNRNYTIDRLFADLARLPGVSMPTPAEIRAASLNWAFRNAKAKRELGWRPSPHEDALEATVAWYRERDQRVPPPGTRQPLPLRAAGGAIRLLGRLGPPIV